MVATTSGRIFHQVRDVAKQPDVSTTLWLPWRCLTRKYLINLKMSGDGVKIKHNIIKLLCM